MATSEASMGAGIRTRGAGFRSLTEQELRAHLAWLRRLASFMVRDDAAADDAVQETLSAAWRSSPRTDRDVKPWLARVLQNIVRTGFRVASRRQMREHRSADQSPDPAPSAEELLSRHEAAHLLACLVSELDEPTRSVLLLHLAKGLTLKQIAQRRGLPEGTIRSQFKRALDDLRARAKKHYAAESRDWRLALAPVAYARQGSAAAVAPSLKGVIFMSLKLKLVTGASLAAVLLLLFGASWQNRARQVAPARSPAADDVGATIAVATNVSPASPPAWVRPPPAPRLLSASANNADQALVACENDMKELLATDHFRNFSLMRPSSKNLNLVAPLVEQVMSRFQPKPNYSLECRVSSCRVVAVSRDEASVRAWFDALDTDEQLAAAGLRSKAHTSAPIRDALTGAREAKVEHYLSVPFRAPGSSGLSHPYDTVGDPPDESAPPSLANCRHRIAAVKKSEEDQLRRRAEVAGVPMKEVGVTVGIELTPRERTLLRATHDRYEARSLQVSREMLADLKGTSAESGELSKEDRRELFDIVIREQGRTGGLREGKVSAIIRRHKRSLAQYWRESLESVFGAARAAEILQATREGRIGGVPVRAPALGENAKGEQLAAGWSEEDWL